jgi:hypothetical protein
VQDARFTSTWKPLADAEHQTAVLDESLDIIAEAEADLVGHNAAGGDIVAVGKAAGDHQHLVIGQLLFTGRQFLDQRGIHLVGAGGLEGYPGGAVAVDAGGAQQQYFYFTSSINPTRLIFAVSLTLFQ